MAYMPPVLGIGIGMDSVSIHVESSLIVRLLAIGHDKPSTHERRRRAAQDFTSRATPELLLLISCEVKR